MNGKAVSFLPKYIPDLITPNVIKNRPHIIKTFRLAFYSRVSKYSLIYKEKCIPKKKITLNHYSFTIPLCIITPCKPHPFWPNFGPPYMDGYAGYLNSYDFSRKSSNMKPSAVLESVMG